MIIYIGNTRKDGKVKVSFRFSNGREINKLLTKENATVSALKEKHPTASIVPWQ